MTIKDILKGAASILIFTVTVWSAWDEFTKSVDDDIEGEEEE